MNKTKCPIVHISFFDHSMCSGDSAGLIECEVIGYLVKQDARAYYVASWVSGQEIDSHNTEMFVILKHKGLKLRKLK